MLDCLVIAAILVCSFALTGILYVAILAGCLVCCFLFWMYADLVVGAIFEIYVKEPRVRKMATAVAVGLPAFYYLEYLGGEFHSLVFFFVAAVILDIFTELVANLFVGAPNLRCAVVAIPVAAYSYQAIVSLFSALEIDRYSAEATRAVVSLYRSHQE